MTNVPRRTIPELLFLHEVEPSLKDIFVEGDYDVAVVMRFLRDIGCEDVVVRSINCIEVDDGKLLRDGRDVGNRERVILLAEEILQHLEVEGTILCIADRDYGNWNGGLPEIRNLVFTDYSCMELYVWNRVVLRRFLTVYCNRPDWSVDEFIEALREPLQSMFAIRLAARSLEMKLKWIDRVVCVEVRGWSILFDVREFVTRLLHKISATDCVEKLLSCVARFRSQFPEEPRQSIQSHDFGRLVTHLLKKKGVDAVATDESTVTRAMAACLTVSELEGERLFQRVVEFASIAA